MAHALDRPAWNALSGPHRAFAEGDDRARRYHPDIIPFAAARDDSPESLAALAKLPKLGETMVLLETTTPPTPPGMTTTRTGGVTQMVLRHTPDPIRDDRIAPLGWDDAPEMLALAKATEPGPFTLKAQALGTFFGIRIGGRIAAMVGERMLQEEYAEISGVCVHPDFRGQGLARLLSVHVIHEIRARGLTPYLHAWDNNTPALRLYETIGFETRTVLQLRAVTPAA
jgi:ribosomal protein S18 acetylase RimI-like enzyme